MNRKIASILFLFLGLGLLSPMNVHAATLSVDSTGSEVDANPGDGICLTAVNTCTLYAAIQEANALAGVDTINFNITGTGLHVIDLTSAYLPNITESVSINGLSQSGSSVGNLQIEILNGYINTASAQTLSSVNISGIAFQNTSLNIDASTINISNNEFNVVNGAGGSQVNISNATSGTISGNIMDGIDLNIHNSSNLNLNRNTLSSFATGIDFLSGENNNNTIFNNTFNDVAWGVSISSGSGNTVSNNTFDTTSHPIQNFNTNSTSAQNLFTQNLFINAYWHIENENGANDNIPKPVIESVNTVGSDLVITGYAKPGSKIEIYKSVPNGSNYNSSYVNTLIEGSGNDTNTNSGPTTLDGQTTNRFTFTIPTSGNYVGGTLIRVTATDANNNTSEFSNPVPYTVPNVNNFELSISQSALWTNTPTPVKPGDTVTYQIQVTNPGTIPVSDAYVTDIISSSATIIPASIIGDGTYNSTTGRWNIGPLAVGQIANLEFKVTVNTGTEGTIIQNTSTVFENDPNINTIGGLGTVTTQVSVADAIVPVATPTTSSTTITLNNGLSTTPVINSATVSSSKTQESTNVPSTQTANTATQSVSPAIEAINIAAKSVTRTNINSDALIRTGQNNKFYWANFVGLSLIFTLSGFAVIKTHLE